MINLLNGFYRNISRSISLTITSHDDGLFFRHTSTLLAALSYFKCRAHPTDAPAYGEDGFIGSDNVRYRLSSLNVRISMARVNNSISSLYPIILAGSVLTDIPILEYANMYYLSIRDILS